MRNRIAITTALLVLLGWPGLLRGDDPVPTKTTGKIGVLNIQLAIANTAEGKKGLAELQAKYQARQQELVRQQQEIQDLQDKLQKQATTLSDEEQVRIRRTLEEKNKIFTRASDDFNASLREDRQDLISRIGQKMVKLINEYAEQNAYALIIDAQVPVVTGDQQVSDGQIQIYYAGKDVNVTQEIVQRYDAAYPVSASSKPVLNNPAPATSRPANSRPAGSSSLTATPKSSSSPPAKPPDKPKE